MESSIILENNGFFAACKIRVGLVVESSGRYWSIKLKSPVSATTILCFLSWSNSLKVPFELEFSSNLTFLVG